MVTAQNDIPTLEWKVNIALEDMTRWIKSAGLNLATPKMEAVLFTRHRRFSPPSFHLKGEQIRLCTALKYLGLWFDGKLTFKEHAKRTAAKAERIIASISKIEGEKIELWPKNQKRWFDFFRSRFLSLNHPHNSLRPPITIIAGPSNSRY